MGTYVGGGELLLGAHDRAGSLGGVERGFAFDGGFALSGTWATDLAADFRHVLPVVGHLVDRA